MKKGNQGIAIRLSSLEALKMLEEKFIEVEYPAQNVHGVPLRFERRRLQVKRVRRFGEDPKDLQAAAKNPMVRRIGLLMHCIDLDKGEPRTFYSGATRGLRVLDGVELVTVQAVVVTISDSSGPRIAHVDIDASRCNRYAAEFNKMVGEPLGIASTHPISAAILTASCKSRCA